MMHIPYERWRLYVEDQLDEDKREKFEDHMYECAQCMALYMKAVEEQEESFPVMFDDVKITDRIMDEISKLSNSQRSAFLSVDGVSGHRKGNSPTSIYQKPIFHYVVAAAMTIILMSTGVFHSISSYVAGYEQTSQPAKPSFTKGLMDKTVSLVDKVEKETKEGK